MPTPWKCPFSWEEKPVAPLIAAPNVDRAIEDKNDRQKTMLQATRVIHACRNSLFFFATNIGSRKQGHTDGTSNIMLPCPGS
jgi:hypothetical protein